MTTARVPSHARRRFIAALGVAAATAIPTARGASPPRTLVFHDPDCALHDTGPGHPETPERVAAVVRALESVARDGSIAMVRSGAATIDDLALVHDRSYIDLVRSDIAAGLPELSTGDTPLSDGSWTAALAAAGAVVGAVDAVMTDRCRSAFCAIRPPGHHVSQRRGMGFGLFNNLAIGVRHAQRRHGVGRVLIADWDVHHGNGTQAIFEADGSVLFFDTHEDPLYPGTGSRDENGHGAGQGLIVNRPFPAGAGRREILGAYRDELVPLADRFRPELVMVSAGFDSQQDDLLGHFRLTPRDYADLTDVVRAIADRHAGGRIVSVLEGGYVPEALSRAVIAHVGRLATSAGTR